MESTTQNQNDISDIKKISLTDKEKAIFKTLMEVVELNSLKTTLRVAGGWVRDKVSG